MMNATTLQSKLAHFTGTENYHRLGMYRWLLATDGVAYLAKNAECFWLLDIIASYQPKISKSNKQGLKHMQFWTLRKTGATSAVVECREESGMKPFVRQEIPYTDFPLDEVKIWVQGEIGREMVMLLPSEY